MKYMYTVGSRLVKLDSVFQDKNVCFPPTVLHLTGHRTPAKSIKWEITTTGTTRLGNRTFLYGFIKI